jgi:hypothetical protein
MRRLFAFFLLVPFFLSGCLLTESPEELERLTKEDPSFEKMILSRNQVHSQISLIKNDLLTRKKAVDAETERLRAAYDAYARAQQQKIGGLRGTIEGYRHALKSQIETAEARLEAKQIEVEGYRKTLGDVRQMLKESKGIELSAKERQKWDERILMLTEKIRPLEDEIRELRLEIRLKNQKIRYLH